MRRYRLAHFLVVLQFVLAPGLVVSDSSASQGSSASLSFKPRHKTFLKTKLPSGNPLDMTISHRKASDQPKDASSSSTADARGGEIPKNDNATNMSSLTKLRRTVFPIYGDEEVTKFLLIGSIKFFIIMALTLTRDTKDTLVVTQCGAEAIAFLKVRINICIGRSEFLDSCLSLFALTLSTDIRRLAGSNSLYRSLLENGVRDGKEDALLFHVHSILYFLFAIRSSHLPKCGSAGAFARVRAIRAGQCQHERRTGRAGQDCLSLDVGSLLCGG